MKFCKYCGTQIADDAVCSCPEAVAEREAQTRYAQPRTPVTPAATQGNNFGKRLLEPLKLYFKNPKQAVDNRIKDKDFVTSLIYIAALFMIMIGVKCFVYITEAVKSQYIAFNFGLMLLAAFLAVLALCTAYVGSRFLILFICGKKPVNAVELLLNSLISFGINSIVPAGVMLLGGVFYMITNTLGHMFFVVAVVWYIVAGLLEIKDEFDPDGNPFVRILVAALVIGVCVALYFLLYQGLYAMNVRISFYTLNNSSPYSYNYNDYSNFFRY